MTFYLFLKGILLGLAIAAPVGPIGALCINRTLARGFWAGVAGGLGTALADGVYALLAASGFAAFSAILARVSVPLGLLGGLFMLWLGWQSLRSAGVPKAAAAESGMGDLFRVTATTFLLTLSNPATILSFAAIFAGLGLASDGTGAFTTTAGVFTGSLLWWFFLCGLVTALKNRLPTGFTLWVSRISGLILLAFGIVAISSALLSLTRS
ncbi:LysE family transporter [Gellertiella hungarica]|uniref:Putative LysE/RhtB family amino acid efflux pump n=1 Tax=Gellertiella hungarica TaxID=1572859 RepID=A0A7W6J625_9HYPH|nr:LysE family transporter [Gellertiella hungarica]MBB4064682.1 putative LysE/RhtB family amino acid efflux pump [Gellertiella hungarica]